MRIGEIVLITIILISLFYFIQILMGKIKFKSKTDGSGTSGGDGGQCGFDCSGGDGGG